MGFSLVVRALTAFGAGDRPDYVEYHWHGLQPIAGNLYCVAGVLLFLLALGTAGRALRTGRALGAQPRRT